MSTSPAAPHRRPSLRLVLAALATVALLLVALRPLVTSFVAGKLRSAATARGLTASWRRLEIGPGTMRIANLALTAAGGDTVLRVHRMSAAVAPASLILLRPRAQSVTLSGARLRLRGRGGAEIDTLVPDVAAPSVRQSRTANPERARRLVHSAEQAVRLLFVPAHRLPRVLVTELVIAPATAGEPAERSVDIDTFRVEPAAAGTQLHVSGVLRGDQAVPFAATATYGRNDRLTGKARFEVNDPRDGKRGILSLAIDGRLHQDRRTGVVRLGDSTHVTIGALPLTISGAVWRRGPRFEVAIAAQGVTADQVHRSLPRPMLGPLLDVSVQGAFDYRLHFDLDLAHPGDVDFTADVIPHGLRLDPARTRLRLTALDAPFTATIHLPHHQTVRELSSANPHFRAFDAIDSLLTHAVVTNEDGGFFRHRGFNTEAVKHAIAENLRAGAYRRGAGTITMQLARNLYLGHQRTLSRKMQEVVLAWILEHLTGISKRRLLEIYFNIIEWGPGVHGADEATHYYFGRDAARLTVDEALFLATIVPGPLKWKYRFAPDGALRPFARAQMHFIGRAMIAKGWLDPVMLPPVDSLRIELKGPAREVLRPLAPDTTRSIEPVEALMPFLP